jgi:hypothetical protein
MITSPDRVELSTSRLQNMPGKNPGYLTVERASQLRHGELLNRINYAYIYKMNPSSFGGDLRSVLDELMRKYGTR